MRMGPFPFFQKAFLYNKKGTPYPLLRLRGFGANGTWKAVYKVHHTSRFLGLIRQVKKVRKKPKANQDICSLLGVYRSYS